MNAHLLLRSCLLAVGLMLLSGCGHVVRKTGDPDLDAMLHAMGHASTWGHPDEAGEYAGMRAYSQGNYAEALKQFRQGARYADKLSQLAIGLMYLKGQGVHKDPVTAFAWVAISAERKYPQFLATRDRIWATLDADQREQARQKVAELYAEYGDKVAKQRMRNELAYYKTQITGSMLGYDSGIWHMRTQDDACSGNDLNSGILIPGCNVDVYADWRMDPDLYFQVKDAQWRGNVVVGELKDTHESGSDAPAAAASSP